MLRVIAATIAALAITGCATVKPFCPLIFTDEICAAAEESDAD